MDRHTQIYWNTTLSCCVVFVCLFSIYSFNRRLVAVLEHTTSQRRVKFGHVQHIGVETKQNAIAWRANDASPAQRGHRNLWSAPAPEAYSALRGMLLVSPGFLGYETGHRCRPAGQRIGEARSDRWSANDSIRVCSAVVAY